MTKPEFYLAPDGSLQPLPESGPLTLTDGAMVYPGREAEPVAEESDPPMGSDDPRPWEHGTLLRLTDAETMGVSGELKMVDGDVLLVDEDERRRFQAKAGISNWGGDWTSNRVLNPRTGTTAWVRLGCVEVVADPTITDHKSWPRMPVGDKLTCPAGQRLSINPRIGMANRIFAPMRWRGYTEGGSFVVERVA